MGSSTIRAQKLANEANVQMTQETNQANRDIAAEANANNVLLQSNQNNWNLQQWERENAYNDPSAQMQRYLQAGINPLWAMSSGDAGQAQHLESAAYSPTEVAQMQAAKVMPEADPSKLGNIVAAANNVANSVQGFAALQMQDRDVSTRERSQIMQASQIMADTAYKKSLTQGQDIQNKYQGQTLSTRIATDVQNLTNMQQEYKKMEADTDNAKALHENILATKDLISAQIQQTNESIQQSWHSLRIQQQNANTNSQQFKLNEKQYDLEVQKATDQMQHMSNQDLLQYMSRFGVTQHNVDNSSSSMGANLGVGLGASGSGSGSGLSPMPTPSVNLGVSGSEVESSSRSTTRTLPSTMASAEAAGIILFRRAASDPSQSNIDDCSEYEKLLRGLSVSQPSNPYEAAYQSMYPYEHTPSSYSILNR